VAAAIIWYGRGEVVDEVLEVFKTKEAAKNYLDHLAKMLGVI